MLESSAADGVFLTWEWVHAWWTHLADGRRPFLLVVRDGEELVAVAPFVVAPPRLQRFVPFRSLEFLGTGIAGSDYLDLIVRRGWEDAALQALAEYLAAQRLMLQLGRVAHGRALAFRLAETLALRGWSQREVSPEVCPFIELSGHTWESYLETLGAAHRYNVQRRLRNLHRRYAVEFVRVTAEEERGPALARLVGLHEARWRDRGQSEAFCSAALVSFHDDVTRRALERGWLRLFELRLDGQPAAALYGFRYGGAFSFYQSGFDPAYASHSVGLVTMALAIKSAIAEGAAEYDLLHGNEGYKSLWAQQARDLMGLEIYPPSLRGRACRHAVDLGRAARRAARRLLPTTVADRLAAGLRGA